MNKIKLLLGRQSRLDRDVFAHLIEQQADMEIVGEVADSLELLVAIGETGADAVVLSVNSEQDTGIVSHLFSEYPHLTVLALGNKGDAYIEQFAPRRWQLPETTSFDLVNALRYAVRYPGADTREDDFVDFKQIPPQSH